MLAQLAEHEYIFILSGAAVESLAGRVTSWLCPEPGALESCPSDALLHATDRA